MIRYRNGAYEIVVSAGVDPATGKERRVSRSVRMAERKRIPTEVLDVEAQLRLEVRDGKHARTTVTFGQALDQFLAHGLVGLSPTTARGYESLARLHLRPALGTVRLDKLRSHDLEALYQRLARDGLSAQTIRNCHTVARRTLRAAHRAGWVDVNVATTAEPPSPSGRPVEAATPEQIAVLLETATDPDLEDVVAFAAATGMRRGELCGWRWSDITGAQTIVARNVVVVAGDVVVKTPKTNRIRRISLGPKTVERLEKRLERLQARADLFGVVLVPDAYILSEEADGALPLHPSLVSGRFRSLAKRAGVPVHFHMLRHASVMRALAAGLPVNDVAEHHGHLSAKMTLDRYGHAMPTGRASVAAAIDL